MSRQKSKNKLKWVVSASYLSFCMPYLCTGNITIRGKYRYRYSHAQL